ncbi:MAG: tetratricopeptide repeat protein [candidate division Zixibacteria bacterium]|nr:tetratricopeptide repeat protein [candidate division Zixibacteria bacterium]
MSTEKEFITPRYQVIKEIGQGGLGKVLEVIDLWEGKTVALKLHSAQEEQKEDSLENFKQEFRLTSELSHPGIVEVYDFGYTLDKSAFYTMEMVQGEELTPEVARPDLNRFYQVVWQICDILEYLHSQDLVHADLKPSNFKLTGNIFSVKLLDFGLARKTFSQASSSTAGTLEYMAPEVFLGQKIDPQTDLYSLGIILFELLTSNVPFSSEDPLILRSDHLEKIAPPPSVLRPELPQGLDSLVLKLLEKKPEDRFQDISELKEALSDITPFPAWGSEKTSYLNRIYGGKILDREKEYEALKKELDESLTRGGRLFLIEGEMGIGKSTLLKYLKREAQLEGILFVQIDCLKDETHPLQPVRELFSRIWPFFEKLHPSFGERYEEIFKSFLNQGYEKESQASSELEKLSSFILEASNLYPFVLAFEDLHHMGEGSLVLLEELTKVLDKSKLFLCGTLQEANLDPKGKLKSLINCLTGSNQFHLLRLPSLTMQDLGKLLSQKLGQKTVPDTLLDFIYQNSSGVPLFALEILKYLFEKKALYVEKSFFRFEEQLLKGINIPDTIEKTILGNLRKYPEEILNFLNLTSVIGMEFDLNSIKFLTGYEEDKTFESLFILLKDRILIQAQKRLNSLTYAFATPTLQSLTYKNFVGDKEALHRKLAYFLEGRKSRGEEIETEEIASHFISSDDYFKAYDYSLICAIKNQKDLDFPQALKYLEKALAAAEKLSDEREKSEKIAQALMQRGDLLKSIGELNQAQKDYEEILKIVEFSENQRLIAETYKDLGDLFRLKHDYPKGLDALLRAKKIFQELKDNKEVSHTLNNLGNIYWIDSQYQKALEVFAEALKIQKSLGDKYHIASTLNNIGSIYLSLHQYSEARRYYTESLEIRKELQNKEKIAQSLNNLGLVEYFSGFYSLAIPYYLESLKLNQETENKKEISINMVNLSESYFKLGDYQKATNYARRGLEIARDIGFQQPVGYLLKSLANIDLETGSYQGALTQLKEALDISDEIKDKELKVSVLLSLGRLFFLLNRSEDANRFLEEALEISRAIDDKRTQIAVGRLKGILLRKNKKTAEALKLLENSIALAEKLNSLEDKLSLSLDLAWAYLDSSQNRMLESYLENAKKIIDQNSMPLIESEYYYMLLRKEFKQGNLNQALEYSEVALEKALRLNRLEIIWRIYFLRGKLSFLKNDLENAYKEYEKAGKLIKALSQNIDDPELKQSYLDEKEKLDLLTDIKKLAQEMTSSA